MEEEEPMEVDGDSSLKQQVQDVENIWRLINEPIVQILSDLAKAGTERLTSFIVYLRSSETLNSILIPRPTIEKYPEIKEKYREYSIWIFGVLFHTLGIPMKNEYLENCIEIQASLLKSLFWYHLPGFNLIFDEYMSVLGDLFDHLDNHPNEPIVINKFKANKDAIENLELISYPTSVEYHLIPNLLMLINKVIIKSEVEPPFYGLLWDKIQIFINHSDPAVILVALPLMSNFIKSQPVELMNEELHCDVVNYLARVCQVISNNQDLTLEMTKTFPDLLADVFENMHSDPHLFNLYFIVLDLHYSGLISSDRLEGIISTRIVNFLTQDTKFEYTSAQLDKFLKYFDRFGSEFSKVLAQLIASDIKNLENIRPINIARSCSVLWDQLQNTLMKRSNTPEFVDYLEKLLSLARLILDLLVTTKIRVKFVEDYKSVVEVLIQSTPAEKVDNFILCFCHLMIVDPSNVLEYQNVVTSPFPSFSHKEFTCFHKDYGKFQPHLKSLKVETKIKCLESLCQFGDGKERVNLLSTCITSINEVHLVEAAIFNSVFLLDDLDVSFNDVSSHILKPAYLKRKEYHREIAKVLGPMICMLSGKAEIIREKSGEKKSFIQCDVCDKNSGKGNFTPGNFIRRKDIEVHLRQYFTFDCTDAIVVRNLTSNLIRYSSHLIDFNSNSPPYNNWLELLRHSDSEIRVNLTNAVEVVVENWILLHLKKSKKKCDEWPEVLNNLIEVNLVGEITKTLVESLESGNEAFLLNLVDFVKNLSKVEIWFVESRILNVLMLTIINSNSSLVAMKSAEEAYKQIAEYFELTPKELFTKFKKELIITIMGQVADNFHTNNVNPVASLHRVTECIGFIGTRDFLRKNTDFVLGCLIPLAIRVPNVKNIFPDIAYLVDIDLKKMFIEAFPSICPQIIINEEVQISTKSLYYIAEISEIPLKNLLSQNLLKIIRELLINFHEKQERVIKFINIFSKFDPERRQTDSNPREAVANYLSNHLHAIFFNLDANLNSLTSDNLTQRSVLASLAALIDFMDTRHLSPLKYKILATLRSTKKFHKPGYFELICNAWNSFIHSITLAELGPILPTICVSLMLLTDTCTVEVNRMLEYLLVGNRSKLSKFISEIFFINDLNVSEKVKMAVNKCIQETSYNTDSFVQQLNTWLRRIVHEADEVRLKALIYLKRFLEQHRNELNQMILNDTNHVDPAIITLLDHLIAGCQDLNEEIRYQCGECLGELGAIEPSLLPRKIVCAAKNPLIDNINEQFALSLLNEFVRAFQMQNNATQKVDSFSLAIQEILKSYQISPTGNNKQLWDSLPEATKNIISPFLTSHYVILPSTTPKDYPIHGTDSGSTLENWIYNWISLMISSIDDKQIYNMLSACKPAFKRDIKTCIFVIPYIVTYTIINSNKHQREGILKEMFSVINYTEQPLDPNLVEQQVISVQAYSNKATDENLEVKAAEKLPYCHVVYAILDHIRRWLDAKRTTNNQACQTVKNFFAQLSSLKLAESCLKSQEYHRALSYLEAHMRDNKKSVSDPLECSLLTEIYTQLKESDGVSGILSSQTQPPTLQQLVLSHKISGNLQEAAVVYDKLTQKNLDRSSVQGMVQCYLGLEQPFIATSLIKGLSEAESECELFTNKESQDFWGLAHFAQLHETTETKKKLLIDIKAGTAPNFRDLKRKLVSEIGTVSLQNTYQQSYLSILKLHVINEFEKSMELILKDVSSFPDIFNEWESRGQLVRASKKMEFVLGMRRAALDLAVEMTSEDSSEMKQLNEFLKKEIGKSWLKSAKVARKAGLYHQAYVYILCARDFCPPQELHIEQAQLSWAKGCQADAFTTLKRAFSNYFRDFQYYKSLDSSDSSTERRNFAKAKLLFANYNGQLVNVETDTNRTYYKEAVDAWKNWEKSNLCCAEYYEGLVNNLNDDDKASLHGLQFQHQMIISYGKSLQFGCKYIHQSLPRMLTIWMNFASKVRDSCGIQSEFLYKMNRKIKAYVQTFPKYIWLSAFSQLVSRICHPSKDVQIVLNTVLVDLIDAYPQQCLWMMASVINSSYPARISRCEEIFKDRKLESKQNLIKHFRKLWSHLIELANKAVDKKAKSPLVSVLCNPLLTLFSSKSFSQIMIPTTKFFQLHLPKNDGIQIDHQPFSNEKIYIIGMEDRVLIMNSLQAPKRFAFRGSDGKRYLFMGKPKDDLRKDFRLMEFNSIVNKYLQKDLESRQRRLYIRTYSVIPLNEECGLIEWIPNLISFRAAIVDIYKERRCFFDPFKIAKIISKSDPIEKKREIFVKKLIPAHPPVFGDWFKFTFPDPYSWYEARTAYIRTAAVISIVGYILGLGDRHGENINFDSTSGDCVHVDFNCLFNHGETFEWPEKVPFRLTHNMVEAMGPLQFDGPFRRCCEVTMRILRQETNTLMSILTPFVYDPLVSWKRNQNNVSDSAEKTNEKAVVNMKDIEQRLKGFIRSNSKFTSVSLSVEGQVNYLIQDATNIDNLCQMWYGWNPFI